MLFAPLAVLSPSNVAKASVFLPRGSAPMFLSQRCLLTFQGSRIPLHTPTPSFSELHISPLFLCVYVVLFLAQRVFSFTKIYFVRAATSTWLAFFIP